MSILTVTNFTKVDGLPVPSYPKVLTRETPLARSLSTTSGACSIAQPDGAFYVSPFRADLMDDCAGLADAVARLILPH
ncbi:MAG: hypothetical protein ABJU46_09245 [Paracoccaceae bacterium]